MQKKEEVKAMTKAIVELKEPVKSLETEKNLLWQTNKGMLQQSSSTRVHRRREKKTMINSLPNAFIGIAVQEEDAIHRWYSKEVSDLMLYKEGKEWSSKTPGRELLELWLERQDVYKIVLYSRFSLWTNKSCFTASETEPEVILKGLAVKQESVQPWMTASSNEDMPEK